MPSCVSVCLFIALGSKFLRQIGILKVVLLWIAARRLAVALWLTPATFETIAVGSACLTYSIRAMAYISEAVVGHAVLSMAKCYRGSPTDISLSIRESLPNVFFLQGFSHFNLRACTVAPSWV